MNKLTRYAVVACSVLALVLAGCGKEDKKGGGGGGGDGKGAGDGKGGGKGDGKGAGKSIDLDGLAAIKPEGWTLEARKGRESVTYTGETTVEPKVGAMAQAGKCEMEMLCPKLDAEEFKKNADNLKAMMSSAIKDDPNTVFEIAAADLAGRKVITVYSYGFVKNGGSRVSNHALNVYWNDGANMITLMLSARGFTSANTFDEYKATIDRAPLDKAAETLMKGFDGKL